MYLAYSITSQLTHCVVDSSNTSLGVLLIHGQVDPEKFILTYLVVMASPDPMVHPPLLPQELRCIWLASKAQVIVHVGQFVNCAYYIFQQHKTLNVYTVV